MIGHGGLPSFRLPSLCVLLSGWAWYRLACSYLFSFWVEFLSRFPAHFVSAPLSPFCLRKPPFRHRIVLVGFFPHCGEALPRFLSSFIRFLASFFLYLLVNPHTVDILVGPIPLTGSLFTLALDNVPAPRRVVFVGAPCSYFSPFLVVFRTPPPRFFLFPLPMSVAGAIEPLALAHSVLFWFFFF